MVVLPLQEGLVGNGVSRQSRLKVIAWGVLVSMLGSDHPYASTDNPDILMLIKLRP